MKYRSSKKGFTMFTFFLLCSFITTSLTATYHSQNEQDRYLNENFFHNMRGGIFVDIGAHNGVTISNTLFYEKELGWAGICVEPLPHIFEELVKNRSCVCINGCVSDKAGIKKFLKVNSATQTEMLSGLLEKYDPRHLSRIDAELRNAGGFKEVIDVHCYTFNELMKLYGIDHIDYLSIDTEGGELDILRSIDFDAISIHIIDVENNYGDNTTELFLASKGFYLAKRIRWDDVYCNARYHPKGEFLLIESLADPDECSGLYQGPGFFACFQSVIGYLDLYEKGDYAGCSVQMLHGLFLDKNRGPNWWEYYFEPINMAMNPRHRIKRLDRGERDRAAYAAISSISRERAYELIQRYVRIKPHIQEKIDNFIAQQFKGTFVLGVHYRGTDKCTEASIPSYEEVYKTIITTLAEYGYDAESSYKIFIATEDARFIDYLKERMEKSRLCYCEHIRSRDGKPIHFDRSHAYQLGEEALIDGVLLSQCSVLVRTRSNLSASAANFNPQLPVISLGTLKKISTVPIR
jgi:FkbM family methyltransferase